MTQITVSSRAEADLVAGFDWYQQKAVDLGMDFLRCVDATMAVIQRSPKIFRKRAGEHRMALVPRFPFAIYFVFDET